MNDRYEFGNIKPQTNSGYLITVFNVGQGDAFILSPHCKHFKDIEVFIDCGSGNRDVFQHRNNNKKLELLLTHSHKDHINGLHYLFEHIKTNETVTLRLPLYFDEIHKIVEFILNLKDIDKVLFKTPANIEFTNILSFKLILLNLNNIRLDVKGLHEGQKLCEHIKIFNPPFKPEQIFDITENEIEEFAKNCNQHFNDWIEEDKLHLYSQGFPVYENNLINEELLTPELRKRFMFSFFYKNRSAFDSFSLKPNLTNFNQISKAVKNLTNDLSVVLKYADEYNSCLFTGDAGKNVFNRLIKSGADISANILKVPHHGSKNNLNKSILKKIAPETAIISHDNGRFGRQIDPHPHKEIV